MDLEEIGWEALDRLLERHRDLPVVLGGVGYRDDRTLYPLLARYASLHIETSRYVGHRALEALANRFSASRMLFGTRLPHSAPGPAITRLLRADLGEDEKRAIGCGNLERLAGAEGDRL